jgi:RNA polymerase sigma-70 factor (ECF subfamily)
VLERGHQYRAQWKFEVWLFSIARHLVIDLFRRKKSDSLDALMNPEDGPGFEPRRRFHRLSNRWLRSNREPEWRASWIESRPAYREVLLLRFQEDLGLEEMASIMKAPLSTVKSKLYRGLELLRKLIEGARV